MEFNVNAKFCVFLRAEQQSKSPTCIYRLKHGRTLRGGNRRRGVSWMQPDMTRLRCYRSLVSGLSLTLAEALAQAKQAVMEQAIKSAGKGAVAAEGGGGGSARRQNNMR